MRILIGFMLAIVAFPALADDVELRQRWDIRGFYHATGATMTESVGSSNIALSLLDENSVEIGPEGGVYSSTIVAVPSTISAYRTRPGTDCAKISEITLIVT